MAGVSVRVLNRYEWPEFAPTWQSILDTDSDASFFLSIAWLDCWLTVFGDELNPDLLAFEADGIVVGCCLLVWRSEWVKGIRLRRVYLNCAGEREADATCTEYNAVLSLPEYKQQVSEALAAFLEDRSWDQLILTGLCECTSIPSVASRLGTEEVSIKSSPYVDLCRLRRDSIDYDSILSANTRQQIRRSRRQYEQTAGPCTIQIAGSVTEALRLLDQLAELHQTSWQARGRAGVFSSPLFTRFHRRLIAKAFDHSAILLMRIQAGMEVIAVLYSFVFRGRVYFYQSGFRYSADGKLKPGLLAHYMAIRYCLEQGGIAEYDFLAGDSQYKRSLADNSRALQWVVIHRPTVPALVFRGLKWLKHRYVGIGAKGS